MFLIWSSIPHHPTHWISTWELGLTIISRRKKHCRLSFNFSSISYLKRGSCHFTGSVIRTWSWVVLRIPWTFREIEHIIKCELVVLYPFHNYLFMFRWCWKIFSVFFNIHIYFFNGLNIALEKKKKGKCFTNFEFFNIFVWTKFACDHVNNYFFQTWKSRLWEWEELIIRRLMY